MLNISFLLVPKLSYRTYSLYCGKWGKLLKAYSDLDLDLMLVRAIFIYYDVFQFVFLDRFLFKLSYKNTHKHAHKHGHTHQDSDKYSIVKAWFSKTQL